jgi:predicted nucleic acid-binding protein
LNTAPSGVVLDTNVVLDWLLFGDARCAFLLPRLQAGRWRWHGCARMRDELAQVLPRPELQRWSPKGEHILSTYDQLINTTADPLTDGTLKCADADDQVFIDLAVAVGARWLFTRDRALLDLARPAERRGVHVLTPASWSEDMDTDTSAE